MTSVRSSDPNDKQETYTTIEFIKEMSKISVENKGKAIGRSLTQYRNGIRVMPVFSIGFNMRF